MQAIRTTEPPQRLYGRHEAAFMASHSLHGPCIQAPFVVGAPGPPPSRLELNGPCCYLDEAEEDEEMFTVHGGSEPDDLGDLMKEMREGAAWATGLAMDCELQMGGNGANSGGGGALGSPSDGQHPAAAAGQACQAPEALCFLAGQQQQMAAGEERTSLQPGVAALLMHPGAGGGNSGAMAASLSAHMIPVQLSARTGQEQGEVAQAYPQPPLSCAARLAAAPMPAGGPDCRPHPGGIWAPPSHYYGGPPPPLMQQPSFCPMPMARQQEGTGMGPSPLSFFNTAPAGFGQPMQQQQAQQAFDPAMYARFAQQQNGGAGQQAHGGYQSQLPEPNSSGNASDGTTLRMRSSFDSDSSGVGSGCQGQSQQQAAAAAPQRQHTSANNKHGNQSAQAAQQAQLCSSFALAAFDQAAFDQVPCGGQTFVGAAASIKCEAASDSSDVEDNVRSLVRQSSGGMHPEHLAQVVPDAMCCYSSQQLPMAPRSYSEALLSAPSSCMQQPSIGSGLQRLPPPHHHMLNAYCNSPAAQTARVARQASLERYRQKKARRGFGKKIRYQARKVNADKRPRVKGRFVKAGEAADMLAAAAAATVTAGEELSGSCGTNM